MVFNVITAFVAIVVVGRRWHHRYRGVSVKAGYRRSSVAFGASHYRYRLFSPRAGPRVWVRPVVIAACSPAAYGNPWLSSLPSVVFVPAFAIVLSTTTFTVPAKCAQVFMTATAEAVAIATVFFQLLRVLLEPFYSFRSQIKRSFQERVHLTSPVRIALGWPAVIVFNVRFIPRSWSFTE